MEKIEEIACRKPNEIIEVLNHPLSTTGWNAYTFILTKMQEEKSNKILVSPTDILKAIGATDSYEELYKHLEELLNTQVSSKDKRGKLWGGFVLLSAFKKTDEGIYLEIPQLIADRMFRNDDLYYTTIRLLEEKSFKCSYSLVFYEIFKKYEKVKIPVYTVEELRQMTRTVDKYKVFYEFKRNVLNPALKEINSFSTKYIYDYEEEYLGRKISKIKFFKILKEVKEPQLSLPNSKIIPSEKLVLAVTKAKSNIYIGRKYRQTTINKAIKQFGEDLVIAGLNKLSSFNKEITSFSALLNSAITEIKAQREFEDLANLKTIKKEEVITPAPAVEVPKSIERETITESEFEKRYIEFLKKENAKDTEQAKRCYRIGFNIIKG